MKDEASLGNKDAEELMARVPTYFLDGRSIIVFHDVCQAVLRCWGSYSKLHNLLKKLGIETCRFNLSQLRMLKNIEAVDMQTKQCSFVTEKDFIKILHKYDEDNNTDNAKYIQFSPPVVIDSHCSMASFQENQNGEERCEVFCANTDATTQSTTFLHIFSTGNQDFVSLFEISDMFETYFHRWELLNSVLQNLKVAVGRFTHNELMRIDVLTKVTCNDGLRRLYITRKDAERVLQYTSAFLDTSPPNVNWVQLGEFDVGVTREEIDREESVPVTLTSSSAVVHIPGNSVNDQGAGTLTTANVKNAETVATSSNDMKYVIRTCLVDGEVVVCIPDLHKTVIDLYGQSVQVGSYMHRLGIPTHRFSSICLKRLKAHSILSSKATLCTYITKADAERLLKMYHLGNYCHSGNNSGDSFPRIEWSEPIILENAAANNSNEGSPSQAESVHIPQISLAKVKIPMFTINHEVVVSMPDVHKAVQLLNGQSVQLHYNLDKLKITKHKYTYSEVHHLKVLGHLNRPSTCTYITKADVERLLQYYTTPENEGRLELIEWQLPVAVEKLATVMASDSMSSPEMEPAGGADGQMAEDYSISDLYKVFVGDDLETTENSSNDDTDQSEKMLQSTPPMSSSSSSSLLPDHNVSVPTTTNEVQSISEQRRAGIIVSSHMSRSQQFCDAPTASEDVVNQMQDVFGRGEYNPVKTSSEGRYDRHTPMTTKEISVACQSYGQATPPLSSVTFSVPYSNTMKTSGITSCASNAAIRTATCARDGHIPPAASILTQHGNCHYSSKRANVSLGSPNDPMLLEQQAKKPRGIVRRKTRQQLAADDEDILKTLQRKETEMKILHDAYQDQIKQERERRLAVQQELDTLRDSNGELLKSIERKELEMKILHDSYKLQMDLERKKREELEIEVLHLRDQFGADANVPRVKQEPF